MKSSGDKFSKPLDSGMVIDMKIRALVMRTGTFILWSKKQRYCNLPNDVSTTSADLKPRICLNGERIQERGLRHTKFKLKLSPIHNKPMLLIWSLAHPLPLQSSQGPCTAWDCSNLLAAMALNWPTTLVSPFYYTTFNTLSESCSGFVYGSRTYILLNPSHNITYAEHSWTKDITDFSAANDVCCTKACCVFDPTKFVESFQLRTSDRQDAQGWVLVSFDSCLRIKPNLPKANLKSPRKEGAAGCARTERLR